MSLARKPNLKNLNQTIAYIAWILLFKSNYVQQNKHNANDVAKANFLRFQNFEPRLTLEQRHQNYYPNETLMLNISKISGHHHSNDYHVNTLHPKQPRENADQAMQTANTMTRQARGFHFQATDKDLTVETEFIIPFAKIPIGWSSNFVKTSMRKILNLQTGALLWSGAFIAVGAIVAGVVNTIIALRPILTNTATYFKQEHQARALEMDQISRSDGVVDSMSFADLLDAKLHEHKIELKACVQRSICRYFEKLEKDVRFGQATGSQKMLLGILRAQNLREFMRGTAVYNAIEAGQNFNCENLKHRCHLPKVEMFFDKYLKS